MSERTGSAESNRRLLRDYFAVMATGGDLADFFTEDVTWVNVESGEQFRRRAAVRDYIGALHTSLFDARPEGRTLDVTDTHAFLEGDFVGTSTDVRVPFCLVYDLGEAGISQMRLYMSFRSLPLRVAEASGQSVPEHSGS